MVVILEAYGNLLRTCFDGDQNFGAGIGKYVKN